MSYHLDELSHKASMDKSYRRNLYQTYLTAAEWRNVEMSEEYAEFLENKQPFYRFPFFYQIIVFWKIFFQSYAAANREQGLVILPFLTAVKSRELEKWKQPMHNRALIISQL